MAQIRKVYWDSGIFIAFLSDTHPEERNRADVAQDILTQARNGDIQIWTSVWTIAEVIRPKSPLPDSFPQPAWAELLSSKDTKGEIKYPRAAADFTRVWEHYKRSTLPGRPIPDDEARKIREMFDWPWINKIDVIPAIANRAADIMRTHNMKAGDSIHVASALIRHCDVIQRWDRDFGKTDHLIPSEEPKRMAKRDPDLFSGLD